MDRVDVNAMITSMASDPAWTAEERESVSWVLSQHNLAYKQMVEGRLRQSLSTREGLLARLLALLGSGSEEHVLLQRLRLERGELLGRVGDKDEAVAALSQCATALRRIVETTAPALSETPSGPSASSGSKAETKAETESNVVLRHATAKDAVHALCEALKALGTELALVDQYHKSLDVFKECEQVNPHPETHVFSLQLKTKIAMVWVFMISDGGPSEEQVEQLWKLAHALLLDIVENAGKALEVVQGTDERAILVDIQGEAYWRLGQLCKMIGNEAAALENATSYVQVYDRKVTLSSLPGCMDFCELKIDVGDFSVEVRDMVLQCVLVAKQAYGEGHVTYGLALQNQVSFLFRQGQFDEAIEVCKQIIHIEEASANNAGRGRMMLAFLEDMKAGAK
ncbi:hypothetical protein BC830DRAFT_1167166 [Chytriomyces sp. MP71]|nr:hypothetical protein BC830DRAFT_1167166 [Chytriomyces sp. MP71]